MNPRLTCQLSLMPSKFRSALHVLALPLLLVVTTVKAEIRCYCNQPVCVATGYMCKSSVGMCFTEHFSYSSDLSKSRHGCVELLVRHKRDQCQGPTAEVPSLPVVLCCKEDMCNYMNTMDINIQVHTKSNHSHMTGPYGYGDDRHNYAYEAALQQDLWFKAAVIAVPIAGGFILIFLILLAARMLRQDSKRQRQLLELRRQRHFKTHLLLADPHHSHLQPRMEAPQCMTKPTRIYRNVNLALSRDSCCTDVTTADQQYVYDKTLTSSLCSSLLPWSKWEPHKSSTLV